MKCMKYSFIEWEVPRIHSSTKHKQYLLWGLYSFTVPLNALTLEHSSSSVLFLTPLLFNLFPSQLCRPPPNSNSSFQCKCDFHRRASFLTPTPEFGQIPLVQHILSLSNIFHNHRWITVSTVICLKIASLLGRKHPRRQWPDCPRHCVLRP